MEITLVLHTLARNQADVPYIHALALGKDLSLEKVHRVWHLLVATAYGKYRQTEQSIHKSTNKEQAVTVHSRAMRSETQKDRGERAVQSSIHTKPIRGRKHNN